MSAPHITDEARAKSFLDGWQAEEKFRAHRNARRRREALALQGGSGVHSRAVSTRPRSLPTGPAPDMCVLALGLVLLVPSAIGLGIALGGYAGISAAVQLWHRIRRG